MNRDEVIQDQAAQIAELQSQLAQRDKEIEVWKTAHKEASEHFIEMAADFRKCEKQRDQYKALAEAAIENIDTYSAWMDVAYGYEKGNREELYTKFKTAKEKFLSIKTQTP